MIGQLDLTDINPEELDSGGALKVPGWFVVRIEDVYQDQKNTDLTVIEAKVNAGPYRGDKVWFRMTDPAAADNFKQAATRVLSVCKRLGLITDEELAAAKKVGTVVTPDLVRAIGKEVWCEIEKTLDKKMSTQMNPVYYTGPTYMPFHRLTDSRVPKEWRAAAGPNYAAVDGNELFAGAAGQKAAATNGASTAAATTTTAPAPAVLSNDKFADF